ncbi:Hsp33 family molecular chaperone HslO [Anaerorhabdus sp.]|jgi:molecular chaperone Hsp33|uniref:Hsp33 family molecular chaperone HslO n=1 Tax=Anaerorhabdus sp. TaxID=1872524 RepID=UPI002FC7CD03
MKDILVKAIALNGKVRMYAARTTELCEQARIQHDLWPTSQAALGRVMSIGAIMAGMLKNEDDKIMIQINGHGSLGTCMVECNSKGDVKGFVGDNQIYLKYNENNKLAVGLAVGTDGYLKVTKSMGMKVDFTGQVALQSGEIGDDFAYYFTVSEQTPSAVSVGVLVNTDYSCLAAGGLLIQIMPDATEEDIEQVEKVVASLQPISTLINEGQTPQEILRALFVDTEILEESPLQWRCDCNKDRFKAALTTLDAKDIQEMIDEDHGCQVKCEYCNKTYDFSEDELKFILEFRNSCGK